MLLNGKGDHALVSPGIHMLEDPNLAGTTDAKSEVLRPAQALLDASSSNSASTGDAVRERPRSKRE